MMAVIRSPCDRLNKIALFALLGLFFQQLCLASSSSSTQLALEVSMVASTISPSPNLPFGVPNASFADLFCALTKSIDLSKCWLEDEVNVNLFYYGSHKFTAFSPTDVRQNSAKLLRLRSAHRRLSARSALSTTTRAMAKPQGTTKVVKSEKGTKLKTPGLSEDRVVDSDSESEQKAPKAAAKPADKAKAVEKEKKEKNKTKTAPKKAAIPPPPPPPKVESSDDDEEESDDLDSDDESTASDKEDVSKKAAANGVKRKADDASSSSEEESSSDESLAEAQPATKKAKTQAQPKKTRAVFENEESVQSAPPPKALPLSSIPAKSFVAPKDFAPIDTSKTHSILASNLQGKQIWHITAPSSLPISEIKTVELDAISNGSTVLTHKGSEYTISRDTSKTSTTFSILLPGTEGFSASEIPISQSLNLQQKIVLPKLTSKQARTETGSEAAADVWRTATVNGEGPRPQPKGMRMRYKPPGFGLGEPGLGSDDDEEEGGVSLPKAKKAKKARRESGEAMEGVEMNGKVASKEEKKRAKNAAKAKLAAGSQ